MSNQVRSSKNRKLVLIDAMAILHRAFHALPSFMTTKKGEPINAIYGLISMLLRIIQDLKPTHIAICFDRKEQTFRQKEYADYQAQRPPTAAELSSQFDKARDVATAFGIPIFEKAGFEADDLIGTISHKLSGDPKDTIDEVIIVTGDRDQFQLVNNKVKLYMPITGLSNAKMMGEKEVVEKMGVFPSQIADFKALVGDPSDNYFGVPGIGPKTAINLLKEFNSLEGIYNNLDKVPEKVRNKLEKEKKSADLSYRLATIVKDMPFEFNLEEAGKWKVDSDKVLLLFSDYGFKTLTKRVKEVGEQITSEKQGSLF